MNRGGSFNDTALNARSAKRNDTTPENASNNLGVRPAKASHAPDCGGRSAPWAELRRTAPVMPRLVSRAGIGRTNSIGPQGMVARAYLVPSEASSGRPS